jgi:hypothetical protein
MSWYASPDLGQIWWRTRPEAPFSS